MSEQILATLKLSKICELLNGDDIQLLSTFFCQNFYNTKQFVFKENFPKNELLLIQDGQIEIQKTDIFDEIKVISHYGSGDCICESALIENALHNTTAQAIMPVKLISIKKEKFNELSITFPQIALKIITQIAKILSLRIGNANVHLANQTSDFLDGSTRHEHDLLGNKEVPQGVLYGIQTLRALENFHISNSYLYNFPVLIQSLAMVKKASAIANKELGLLPTEISDAIETSCSEIIGGKHHKHFVVDMIQGGAGTSTNMNANEVIANRALEILGKQRGEYNYCHPNNHVNLSQSTNDAYPTAVKIALVVSNKKLVSVLLNLVSAIRRKSEEFSHIIKMGRTQLQDAVPMTLGQEFEAYAITLEEEVRRLNQNSSLFLEVNMGATAIGTGINADPEYREKVIFALREVTGLDLESARNLVEATQDTGVFIMYSSAVKRLAIKLSKICNDLRLLSSGPRCGFNEINLPPMQPGSSIMPGKVNPVIPEVVNQIAFKVIGNDLTVNLAVEAGQLELNVMEPIMVYCLFQNIEMLKNGMNTLIHKCITGITANESVCKAYVYNSIGLVTALNPFIGYEASTQIAKEALETGKGVYELVLEKKLLSVEDLDQILNPQNMISPHKLKLSSQK